MVQVYIALGSNLNTPTEQLNSALEAISALPNTELKSVSGFYQSKPLGPQDQPDYVNAVAMIETTRPPLALSLIHIFYPNLNAPLMPRFCLRAHRKRYYLRLSLLYPHKQN